MKARFVFDTSLPGAIVIEAETPEECLILRNFCNWPHNYTQPQQLAIASWGGNIAEGRIHLTIAWRVPQ